MMKLKFSVITMMLLFIIVHNPTSQYIGVSWNRQEKKWKAELTKKQKKYFAGYFDNEKDAAMSVNLLCDKFEVDRKNPTINMISFEAHQVKYSTSIYSGVSWINNAKKWQADLMHKKKKYYGGLFENEEHAAMKVNSLCDKFGIQRKNAMIELGVIEQAPNHTSIYSGVSWHNNPKKWQAQLMHKRKQYFGGLFDKQEHAAMKINLLCDELGIQRKNPMIIIDPDAIKQIDKSSQYIGVSWSEGKKGWKAQMVNKKKQYCGGFFDHEKDAAMKINLFCDELEIKRKNPMIDIELDTIRQHFKIKTSIYIGVCWNNNAKKWEAKLKHNQKLNYDGLSDKEEDAAMKVNLLCDKFGIQRKNPMIDIEIDVISLKTKSKMYQLEAENTVKVEDENLLDGFKDGCENNFMQSQKRKRKRDSDIIED